MLLDLIHAAEEFIYIENQFASREEIAEALNQQLKRKPQLKVLVVSSYEPKGTMECEAYWAGRIDFKNIVENGVRPDRIRITHSSAQPGSGDAALKQVCDILVSQVRQTDIVGRLGGDEFGVILTHAGLADARQKADSLVERIDGLSVSGADPDAAPVQLGASCGVIEWTGQPSADLLIAEADEAMFRAKTARKSARV